MITLGFQRFFWPLPSKSPERNQPLVSDNASATVAARFWFLAVAVVVVIAVGGILVS